MGRRIRPSKQVEAAHNMGKLEARVANGDATLKASDFTKYFINCEEADMMADNRVLKFIIDKNLTKGNFKLNRLYTKYKSKYWK